MNMSKYLKDISESLKQFNISIFKDETNTELKSAYEVFREIAEVYNK